MGVCAWGAAEVDPRGLRLSRVPPVPPGPPVPHRGVCGEATETLCGSHTEAVWQPHRLCGSHTRPVAVDNSTIGAVQQPQGLVLSYNSTIVAAEQARIRPENIESGTNGVGKAPFGLKLCVVRAVPLRMPPACLDCQKTQKSAKKHGFWRFSGPGPSSPYFRPISWCGKCAAGWREALITLVWNTCQDLLHILWP